MRPTAEIGSEMFVWLQVYHATDKKVWGLGKKINDFAGKQLERLLAEGQGQSV